MSGYLLKQIEDPQTVEMIRRAFSGSLFATRLNAFLTEFDISQKRISNIIKNDND